MRKELHAQIKDTDLIRKKRLQIAMGASRLFIKNGYAQTSIREITKATRLTTGNLYDYITKKEDILYLVFDVFHSVWVNSIEKDGFFEIENPLDQLKVAIRKLLELVNENRDMVLLMYTESKSLPKYFLKTILEKEAGLVNCFEKILKTGVEKRVFKIDDPFLLANTIVYLLSIEPLRGWNFRKRYKIEQINRYIEEFIINPIVVH